MFNGFWREPGRPVILCASHRPDAPWADMDAAMTGHPRYLDGREKCQPLMGSRARLVRMFRKDFMAYWFSLAAPGMALAQA